MTFAMPTSTPAARPTTPTPSPPAKVRLRIRSVAVTATPWFAAAPAMIPPAPWLTVVLPAMNALTTTVKRLTPMPPARPTKPPATPAVIPKAFSDEEAWTARPTNPGLVPKLPSGLMVPLSMPGSRPPWPSATTTLLPPR